MTTLNDDQQREMVTTLAAHFAFKYEDNPSNGANRTGMAYGDIKCLGCGETVGNYDGWGDESNSTDRQVRRIFAGHQVGKVQESLGSASVTA